MHKKPSGPANPDQESTLEEWMDALLLQDARHAAGSSDAKFVTSVMSRLRTAVHPPPARSGYSRTAWAYRLLLGFEASDQLTDAKRSEAAFGATAASRITVPLAQRLTLPTVTFGASSRSSQSKVRALSAYIQDQIDLGDLIKVVLGLRYDDFRITSTNRVNNFRATRSDGKWSPRAGLIFKPQENISLYASYAKSFLPQSGDQFTVLDATTATLAPEEFRNLEAGVKWDLSERLAFTAALFQIDRSNTRANDPVTGVVVQTGKSRTKGFEAAMVGQLAKGLQAYEAGTPPVSRAA